MILTKLGIECLEDSILYIIPLIGFGLIFLFCITFFLFPIIYMFSDGKIAMLNQDKLYGRITLVIWLYGFGIGGVILSII